MAGSTIGNKFTITTWGESHGKALGVVVDGCPAGLPLSEEEIQKYLDRRKPGTSPISMFISVAVKTAHQDTLTVPLCGLTICFTSF